MLDMLSLGAASWLEWEDWALQSSSAIPGRQLLPQWCPSWAWYPWEGEIWSHGDHSMGTALLWDGEAENLNKVAGQPLTAGI